MSREAWDQNAKEWARRLNARTDLSREYVLLPAITRLLAGTDAARILDAGCGSTNIGASLRGLHEAEVVGVDYSFEMCREAVAGEERVGTTICGDISHLPFADASFDAAVANMVLQGVEDLEDCSRELARVLKPRGVFLFSLLNPARLAPVKHYNSNVRPEITLHGEMQAIEHYSEERRIHVRLKLGHPSWLPAPVVYHHRMLSSYAAALRASGFVTLDIREPLPPPSVMDQHPHIAPFWRLAPFLVWIAQKG